MNFIRLFTLAFTLALISTHSFSQDFSIGNTGIYETEVAVGVQVPWEILWGPDNFLWITERRGRVQRINPTTGETTQILNIQSDVDGSFGEPGMLGMALHPDFENTPLVYIVYTKSAGATRNKLVSYEWNGSELVNEITLLDNIHAGGIHAGARLIISQDQKIFLTVGDGGDGGASSQSDTSLGGKLLRINLDGSIPSDNPDPSSYIYSKGHRNAQGLTQAPNGKIYSSEHGQSAQDEINLIEPEANYGWPAVEGFCDDFPNNEPNDCAASGYTEPLMEWRPCMAVNDIIYYDNPAIPELDNTILMCVMKGFNFQSDRGVFILHLNDDGTEMTFDEDEDIIIDNRGRVRDICVDPNTGDFYLAVNGNSYPGSGPNTIYKYSVNEPLSIAENERVSTLSIYPNPSDGNVKFSVNEHLLGGQYKIISYDGKTVEEGKVSSLDFNIQNGSLDAGSYYIIINGTKGSVSRTFIVQ